MHMPCRLASLVESSLFSACDRRHSSHCHRIFASLFILCYERCLKHSPIYSRDQSANRLASFSGIIFRRVVCMCMCLETGSSLPPLDVHVAHRIFVCVYKIFALYSTLIYIGMGPVYRKVGQITSLSPAALVILSSKRHAATRTKIR